MPIDLTDSRCYAVRRVNPFRGVYQVIETPAGRAVSANGVVWDIEVSAERSSGWGSLNRNKTEQAYIRYGLWSIDDGLVNRPLSPRLGDNALSRQCREVIAAIEQHIDSIPFALEDTLELWLLDSDKKTPLALLASRLPQQSRPSPEPKYWTASIGTRGVPSQHRYTHADELEIMVKERAGFNINKCWFQRQPDGSGKQEKSGERIDAIQFPAYLVCCQWDDPIQRKLVEDYVNWIAPSLLTLQCLSDAQRQHLEQHLHIQAVSVEHHWHLYPRIIDDKRLKSARVQCRLQQN